MSDDEGNDVEFDDKTTDYNYKLILVGESGVGKTSIITRYVEDSFSEEHDITVNVAFFEKIFDIPDTKKKAKLHVWDTLGQEKFTNLAQIFFKGTAGAFLVFDCSRKETFEKLEKWK